MDTKKRLIKLIKTLLYTVSMWAIFIGVDTIPTVKAAGDMAFYTDIQEDYEEAQSDDLTVDEEVTLELDTITGIRVDTSTFKQSYTRGENVDVSSLIVKRQFSNGTEIPLDIDEYTISAIDTSTCGIKVINVTSGNFSKTVEIEVIFNVNDVEDYKMYSSTSLNLRKGPGTEFEVLGSISLNDEVLVIAEADNGWVKVLFNNNEYYCSKSYLMNEPKVIEVTQLVNNSTSYNESTSIMTFDGNISKECRDKAIALYNKIPSNIIDTMRSDGVEMIVTTDSSYTNGNCGRYYPIQWYGSEGYEVCIYAKSVWAVDIAVIHETGHWIDDYLGRKEGWGATGYYGYNGVSSDETWIEIYNAEVVTSGYPSWSNRNAEEYFAESVWKALAEPGWCSKTIPRTYEYIMNCINRVE